MIILSDTAGNDDADALVFSSVAAVLGTLRGGGDDIGILGVVLLLSSVNGALALWKRDECDEGDENGN